MYRLRQNEKKGPNELSKEESKKKKARSPSHIKASQAGNRNLFRKKVGGLLLPSPSSVAPTLEESAPVHVSCSERNYPDLARQEFSNTWLKVLASPGCPSECSTVSSVSCVPEDNVRQKRSRKGAAE